VNARYLDERALMIRSGDGFLLFLVGILGGVAVIVSVFMSFSIGPSQLKAIKMDYSDLISISLTAVTVILAVLAVFIGLLAVWGYSQFQSMTRAASANHLEKILKEGPFSKKIDEIILRHVTAQLTDGELRKLVLEKLEVLLVSDAGAREAVGRPQEAEAPFKD
jgi:uncharacterized membrane protein YdbT with pleckstrin-like domain